MLAYCQLDSQEQISIKFIWKSIQKDAFKDVICEMATILSCSQDVFDINYKEIEE